MEQVSSVEWNPSEAQGFGMELLDKLAHRSSEPMVPSK